MNLMDSTAVCGRILVTILWLGVASAAEVGSSTTATCVDSKSDFSGIPALTYATVTGDADNKVEANARLYFYSQPPSKCAASDSGACKEGPYLVPGDTVAVGASCNGWDYVQYLGEKKVTVGWVDAGRLGRRPSGKDTQRLEDDNHDGQSVYHFKLTKGQGTPVCEAYLQRLNQTAYDDHPYCGLPENDRVPGFTKLNRVYLSTDRINDLHSVVDGFLTNSPPSHYYLRQRDGTVVLPSAKNPVFSPKSRRSTWSYDPPVVTGSWPALLRSTV